jgi:hypothetical protein
LAAKIRIGFGGEEYHPCLIMVEKIKFLCFL